MGQSILRKLLCQIKSADPCWFSIIVDETADIACHEQLNLTIRYVNNDYIINEDSIGLFSLPDTTAKTLHVVVKDLLIRCNLRTFTTLPRTSIQRSISYAREKERACNSH